MNVRKRLYPSSPKTQRHLFDCWDKNSPSHLLKYPDVDLRNLYIPDTKHPWVGEFFPIEISPFAYNETVAQEYFPLSKKEVLEKGWKWKEVEEPDFSGVTKHIPALKLPETIEQIPDDILNWAIECAESKRLFKIQKAELDFHRQMHLPIPRLHPDVRHAKRMQLRNPRKLWNRNCANCSKSIETTYTPERPEIVYCDECYLKAVY